MRNIRQIGKIRNIARVSLGGKNYGMEFLQANTDAVVMPIPHVAGNDFYIKARVKATGLGETYYAMGDNVTPRMWFGINQSSKLLEAGVFGVYVTPTSPSFELGEWQEIEIGWRSADDLAYVLIDGIEKDTTISTGATSQDIIFNLGKIDGGVSQNSGSWIVDWIDANGEMFSLNKIVAGKIVGSQGTEHVITTDRVDVNDMLIELQ